MSTATPFAYNTGSPISGTEQVGDLAVGFPTAGFSSTGLQWWNGPDEDLGYVIAHTVPNNSQPTPVPDDAIILSPTYKGTDISLTNNNQTAAQIFSYSQTVLGETIISGSNKVMFSIKYTSTNPSVGVGGRVIGVGLTTMNYSGPFNGYPGNDTNSIGFSDDGQYYFNGVGTTGFPTWTDGDIIDIAIAHGQYWWIRVNGGDWNNNPSANPATLSGGSTMNGLTDFYPALCPYIYGTMEVLNNPSYGYPSGYNFLGNVSASVGFYRSPLKTEQSFVDMVNQFFNQTFTTGNQCKTYLNNNGYWTSYVSNLVLHLDASDINSYPGSGTVWYDISGNGNDVTMVNSSSITWNNTGPVYFSTGSNGWFNNSSGTNLPVGNSEYTFIVWVKLGSSWSANGFMSVGPFGGSNQANAFRAGTTNQLINYWWANDLSVTSSLSPTDNWFNAVCKFDGITRSIWVNGVLVGSDTPVGHNVTTSALQIAKTTSTEYLNGEIGEALIYNIALSNSQIVQYYNNTVGKYAGLVLSLDAGNPLSYPGTGTTWTDLVGGKVFNLINGPGFNSGNGGKFYFNALGGQYAECSTSLPSLPQFTTSVWHYWDGTNTGGVPTILTEVFIGGPINYFVGNLLGVVAQSGYFNGGFQVSPQFTLIPNNWYQIVTTCDSSQVVKVYVNNTLISTTPTSGSQPSSSNAGIRLMRRWDDPDFWGGYLATVDIYNNALNATQITNLWNSTKSRFGL